MPKKEIENAKSQTTSLGKQFFWATLGLSIFLLTLAFVVTIAAFTKDDFYNNNKLDRVFFYDLIKTALQSDEIVFEGDCGAKLLGNSTSLTTVDVDCKFTRIKIGKVSE